MRFEDIGRLAHQRHTVGQKQNALGPVSTLQQVHQRDHRARLARAGSHYYQGLALAVALKGFANAANGAQLVMALHDIGVDGHARQRLGRAAALHQQLQFVLLVETLHRARRISGVIPEPVFITISGVDQRALAKLRLQAVGIQLGLLLSHAGVAAGALGLHHGQGLAIVTPEHVVHKTCAVQLPLCSGHALHFIFAVSGLVQLPACFLEQQVDVEIARLGFVVVVCIGCGGVGGFGGGYLGAQLRQLCIQCCSLLLRSGQCCIARGQLVCQRGQFLQRCLRGLRAGLGCGLFGCCISGARQQLGAELQRRIGPRRHVAPVVARQPKRHLKQLAQHGSGVCGGNGPGAVHGVVALLAHHVHLGVQRRAYQHLKTGLEQKGRQVGLVGHLQAPTAPTLRLEQPHHRQLQRAPGVETSSARVGQRGLLGLGGLGVKRGPFGLQKREIGRHQTPYCLLLFCSASIARSKQLRPFPGVASALQTVAARS